MTKLTDEEETTRKTYNKKAVQWAARHTSKGFWHKEIRKLHALLPNGTLLEIGSGSGRDAKEFIALGYGYVGTDISSGLLDEARKNNPGADFREISLYDLNFTEKFDGFWCSAVLLHIPRQRIDEALQAIRKNIKQGGLGFISIKQGVGENMETDGHMQGSKRYFVYWQPEDFRVVLQTNGFEVIEASVRPLSERTRFLTYIVKVI
jgi:SAM-dependent methyltransferase